MKVYTIGLALIGLLCLLPGRGYSQTPPPEEGESVMEIKSTAFENGGAIPAKFTCDGANVSPPLSWNSVPGNARSLALICDDPDAPVSTWVHWVIFNLPPDSGGLPEHVPTQKKLSGGALQGSNDFRKIGYGGPCPPGGTHRYFFKLYALDMVPDLSAGSTKAALERAMEGHIVGQAQLMGTYSR